MTTQWIDALVGAAAPPKASCLRLIPVPYVRVDGCDVGIPEGSQRLLVLLALRRGRTDRRVAAATLWPDAGEDRAAGNLRSALWRLKRVGLDLIRSDKQSVWADPALVVDVDVVDAWASRLITGTSTEADLRLAHTGAEVVELLPGWYDDWVLLERERSRQRLLHALEALSAVLAGSGRVAEALDVALSVVAAEPLRESGQRVLVAAHLAEGNWAEARRSYLAYCGVLHEELGIAPPTDGFASMVEGGSVAGATAWLRSVAEPDRRPTAQRTPAQRPVGPRLPARV